MKEPTLEAIGSVSAVLGLHEGEASRWLKAYDCDPEKATNAYFDNGGILQESSIQSVWNESQFHADKNDGSSQPSFAIHHPDTLNPQIFNDNAPSRPPSRASAKGPATITNEQNGNRTNYSLAEQERQDIDQAMAMSQSMGQENGVTETQKPQFGPATREHYDTAKWTMTLPGAVAREIIANPDPSERQREPHSPAFLKPSLEDTRLPALVTILHAIPLAREALLNLDNTLPDYGVNDEWWDGAPIDRRTLQVAGSDKEDERACYTELMYELQRLMAFLDGTERAYGSADALLQLFKATEEAKFDKSLGKVLEAWSTAVAGMDPDTAPANVFVSEASKVDNARDVKLEVRPFCTLDLHIPKALEPGTLQLRTLYDVLDFALWADLPDDASEYAFLSNISHVICIQLQPESREQGAGLGVRIPPTCYLDRYLGSSKEQVMRMLATRPSFKEEITRIDQAKARIMEYKPSNNDSAYNGLSLLKQAREHFAKLASGNEVKNEGQSIMTDDSNLKVLNDLERLSESVERKLQALETSRTTAIEEFADTSQWYRKASDDPQEPPHHKYTLRGVSAAKDTTYVLEKVSAEESAATSEESSNEWQWWKLTYSSGQKRPVSRIKVREVEVLKAARDESPSVLLVYADETAMSSTVSALPSQLQNFVVSDNMDFRVELAPYLTDFTTAPEGKVDDLDDGDMVTEQHHSSDDDRTSVDTILGDDPAVSPPRRRSASRSPPHSRNELG